MGGQVRTHTRIRACKPGRRVRVYALRAHVRTHDISSRVSTSERASERTSVGVRTRVGGERRRGRGEERHTGDVTLTKGRNNISVDLLKSRLFLARAPPSALPFWYFERPSRNRVDFSTEPLTDRSLIKKTRRSRIVRRKQMLVRYFPIVLKS